MSAAAGDFRGFGTAPWTARRQDYTTWMSVCKGMPLPLPGPICDMPECPLRVGYRGQTGLVVLTLSLAAFDPLQTWTAIFAVTHNTPLAVWRCGRVSSSPKGSPHDTARFYHPSRRRSGVMAAR